MNEQKADWETVGFVGASKYRESVLMQLATNGASTPSQLSETTGHNIASISHALSRLRDHELAELLVDESRNKGRYYGATEAGESAANRIEREVA